MRLNDGAAAGQGCEGAIEGERLRVRVCRESLAGDLLKRLMPEWGNRVVVGAARSMFPSEFKKLG